MLRAHRAIVHPPRGGGRGIDAEISATTRTQGAGCRRAASHRRQSGMSAGRVALSAEKALVGRGAHGRIRTCDTRLRRTVHTVYHSRYQRLCRLPSRIQRQPRQDSTPVRPPNRTPTQINK